MLQEMRYFCSSTLDTRDSWSKGSCVCVCLCPFITGVVSSLVTANGAKFTVLL